MHVHVCLHALFSPESLQAGVVKQLITIFNGLLNNLKGTKAESSTKWTAAAAA